MGVVSTVIGDGRHYKFAAENHASKGLKINKGWIVKFMLVTFPRDASEKEIERAFCYYGLLRGVWVARNPAGFAFVEYEDPRDAEDLDGTNVCGSRVRVEHSTGKVRPKPWMRRSRGPQRTRRPFHPEDRCFECGDRGHYAYDCSRFKRGGQSRSSRNRTSRSRSHSRSGRSFSRSWSRSRSRSRSPRRVNRSHSWLG